MDHIVHKIWKLKKNLQYCLELFDFTKPLPKKTKGTWRIFYNNCNGVEINATVSTYLKQQREKKSYNYIKDIEAPTKLDGIIQQMKVWEVDILEIAEMCTAWEDVYREELYNK